MTDIAQSTASTTPELDKFKAAFLKSIEEKGIVHTFEWMNIWFDGIAQASVTDEMNYYLVPHEKNKEAINLYLMNRLMILSRSASNFSSSASANLFNQSRMAVMAKMIDNNREGYGSGAQIREATNAFYAQPHIEARTKEYLEKVQS